MSSMSATVLSFVSQLTAMVCGECGIQFAVPEDWRLKRVAGEGGNRGFFCPSGHSRQYVGETEEQKLRRQLEAERAAKLRAEEREASLRKQRQHLENRLHGTQGALTKFRKRVGNGACPCCKRSFANLANHMKTKHPGFTESEVQP